MLDLFVATLAALFSVVNPFGAVPVFLAMTPHYTAAERNKTALQTSIYFVLILMSFFLAGTAILSFFGISLNAMRIAGGMVILSSGFGLLSVKFAESRAINQIVKEEALFVRSRHVYGLKKVLWAKIPNRALEKALQALRWFENNTLKRQSMSK